jgi:hypothetical protein
MQNPSIEIFDMLACAQLTGQAIYIVAKLRIDDYLNRKIFKRIAEKNFSKMYFPPIETIFKSRYTNPKVIQSLTDNSITNILIS